jgi:aminomethyltransferase
MTLAAQHATYKRSPLHTLNVALGAQIVPFAGYQMPLRYPSGIIKEHLHTRAAASLFDISHMGQIVLQPLPGIRLADVALALEGLVPGNILGLAAGRQRYALFTNSNAGIIDDLMIAHCGDHFLLIVNGSRTATDEEHLRVATAEVCAVKVLADRALLAVQGPQAEGVLAGLVPDGAAIRFMDVRSLEIAGSPCVVSRSGYTGEDGFEISVAAAEAESLARTLLENAFVAVAGLGARDSLRTEAGLCLYGSDLDEMTTPVEAALEWAIAKVRRRDGARCGGFPGAEVILRQLNDGPRRQRVGLRPQARLPLRAGAPLFAADEPDDPIGKVTSGGFGPSVDAPVAMGYVPRALSVPGTVVFGEVRGNRVPAEVTALPIVPHRYKRT